ncbi:MAG: AraC family transcriptional regulator [Nevskia sp.]|nr:AraC family transcriptional regulator [Nevskia sp.]
MTRTADTALRGVVPSTYVRLLFEYLERHGHQARTVLGEDPPAAGDRGLGRYPVARWRALLERAAARLQDPLLGLHLGRTITPAHFGVMGYVLLACPSLGAALLRFQQYQRLLYDVNPMRHTVAADAVTLEWGVESGHPGPLVDECAITALVQFSRDITGRRGAPLGVEFVNPQPPDLRPYRAYFGCPVQFDRPLTRVRLAPAMLALPLRQPDPALLGVLQGQADALLAELPQEDDFERAVRRCVARLAREGEPSLQRVADELHLSPRTLHRRLEQNGRNFRELLEDTRRHLADDYLRDPRLRMVEIALLLGYSEQSAFTRAYRRWTGSTPKRARRQPP